MFHSWTTKTLPLFVLWRDQINLCGASPGTLACDRDRFFQLSLIMSPGPAGNTTPQLVALHSIPFSDLVPRPVLWVYSTRSAAPRFYFYFNFAPLLCSFNFVSCSFSFITNKGVPPKPPTLRLRLTFSPLRGGTKWHEFPLYHECLLNHYWLISLNIQCLDYR